MEYRRFGKTGLNLSVITLGGMRYAQGWGDPRDEIPQEMIDNCRDCVQQALACGINHIESAHGYKRSETCYGKVLNEELSLPRDSYYLMTKGAPDTADATKALVEEQLKALQTDRIDLYGWHGINNRERCEMACAKGGPVEALLKLKDEGVIGSVGFSTHGPLEVILRSIETDLFDFVNLHYYYFYQRNRGAVELAQTKDMGVFIISPNDKGGQLFNAPDSLRELTAPLTPIQWNARFCLSNPAIQTLSFGMTEASHFEEMKGIFPTTVPLQGQEAETYERLNRQRLKDPYAYYEGHERMPDPSGINIPEVLRFRMMWKCFGMKDYGIYRYNMLEEKGHWFPGHFALPEFVDKVDDTGAPVPLKTMLTETHEALYKPKETD